MAGIKIVDLPALGRDLLSTDLFEMSIGGTASRKITGQEIMNASKLNVGSTPIVSGTVGRVLFEGTGNVLQQSSSLFWDSTNNRLGIGTSSPAFALDVNADNAYFGLNRNPSGSGPALFFFRLSGAGGANVGIAGSAADQLPSSVANDLFLRTNGYSILFGTSGTTWGKFFTTGNLGINTTTDAGFRLDVNGTTRLKGTGTTSATTAFTIQNSAGTPLFLVKDDKQTLLYGLTYFYDILSASSGLFGVQQTGFTAIGGASYNAMLTIKGSGATSATSAFQLLNSSNTELVRVWNDGNVGIGAGGTNAGFRLDVNGTARVSGLLTAVATSSSQGISINATISAVTNTLRIAPRDALVGGSLAYDFAPGNNNRVYFGSFESLFTGTAGIQVSGQIGYAGGSFVLSSTQAVLANSVFSNVNNANGSFNFGIPGVFKTSLFFRALGSWNRGDFAILSNNVADGTTPTYASDSKFRLYADTGNITIGNNVADVASSKLTIESTTQGFLPPRMTNAQRTAIVSPAVGLIVYCTDVTEGLWVFKSTGWTFIV